MAMYFTTDTHFGHPLVSALRGFIADADIKAGYDHAVAEQGIAAAAQYVKRAANKRHLRMADIADTDAHDAAVIASINATLTPADELWIMGDIGYRTSMEHIRHCLHAIHARRLHLVVGNHDVNFHHRELDGEWHHAFATIQDSATVTIGGVEYHLSHFPYRTATRPVTCPTTPTIPGTRPTRCRGMVAVCCSGIRISTPNRGGRRIRCTSDWTRGICGR